VPSTSYNKQQLANAQLSQKQQLAIVPLCLLGCFGLLALQLAVPVIEPASLRAWA